jgi:hypothetical protein
MNYDHTDIEDLGYEVCLELAKRKASGKVLSETEFDLLVNLMAQWNLVNMDSRDLREFYYEARVESMKMTDANNDLESEIEMMIENSDED